MNDKQLKAGIELGEGFERLSGELNQWAESVVRGVSIGRAKFADDEIRNAVEVLKSYGCVSGKDYKKLLKKIAEVEEDR